MRLRIPVSVRWGDLDAFGHVNNVAAMRLLEEARIEAFWHHDGAVAPTAVLRSGPGATTHTVVAAMQVEYLVPILYRRDPVIVELWMSHLGGASLEIWYRILDDSDQVYLQASTTMVVIDATTGAPRRLNAEERAAWEPYVEAPPELRRSGSRANS
jgi:acyl-CoA thioester hydrolase